MPLSLSPRLTAGRFFFLFSLLVFLFKFGMIIGLLLGVNFSSLNDCDTWLTVSMTWHTLQAIAQTLDNGMAEQSFLRDCRPIFSPCSEECFTPIRLNYDWSSKSSEHSSPDECYEKLDSF